MEIAIETDTQIPGAVSWWRLNIARWRWICMDPRYWTCFTSHIWRLEFWKILCTMSLQVFVLWIVTLCRRPSSSRCSQDRIASSSSSSSSRRIGLSMNFWSWRWRLSSEKLGCAWIVKNTALRISNLPSGHSEFALFWQYLVPSSAGVLTSHMYATTGPFNVERRTFLIWWVFVKHATLAKFSAVYF
jgi:hypothetical protein